MEPTNSELTPGLNDPQQAPSSTSTPRSPTFPVREWTTKKIGQEPNQTTIVLDYFKYSSDFFGRECFYTLIAEVKQWTNPLLNQNLFLTRKAELMYSGSDGYPILHETSLRDCPGGMKLIYLKTEEKEIPPGLKWVKNDFSGKIELEFGPKPYQSASDSDEEPSFPPKRPRLSIAYLEDSSSSSHTWNAPNALFSPLNSSSESESSVLILEEFPPRDPQS